MSRRTLTPASVVSRGKPVAASVWLAKSVPKPETIMPGAKEPPWKAAALTIVKLPTTGMSMRATLLLEGKTTAVWRPAWLVAAVVGPVRLATRPISWLVLKSRSIA